MASLRDELEKKLQDSDATPMSLPLEFLKAITCDFSTESELGRGGYGVVYKGVLRNGKIIAVKKLFEIHLLDDKTFQNEVTYLMEIKHQNVVQLIGYCAESSWETMKLPSGKFIWAELPKRLLCFEYVCNKSLDKYITDESLGLEWNMRYETIKGICNGLHFLHEECQIIHVDLKPANVMMDATMMPKIADFGLSRIFGTQQSRIVTINRAGSHGYMAPEYLIQGLITKKADIFSLGVIIIEIITGGRDYPYFHQDSPQTTAASLQQFTEKVLGSWRNKFESTSKYYVSMEQYNQQIKQCITIALKCVDPDMAKRPTAKDIVQVLTAVDLGTSSHVLMHRRGPCPYSSSRGQGEGPVCPLPRPGLDAREESLSMQRKDKLLVQDTTGSKELIPHSATEEMSNNETDGKVGHVKKSPESLSSTCSQNHQEAAKESSEPRRMSNVKEEDGLCDACRRMGMSNNETDGKAGDVKKPQESLSPTHLTHNEDKQIHDEEEEGAGMYKGQKILTCTRPPSLPSPRRQAANFELIKAAHLRSL